MVKIALTELMNDTPYKLLISECLSKFLKMSAKLRSVEYRSYPQWRTEVTLSGVPKKLFKGEGEYH